MATATRLILALVPLVCACSAMSADESDVRLTAAQSRYMEDCGGCHGIQGSSAKDEIPELRGSVGWFLCSQTGREYIVRLPNVAFANADDPLLADVMNFVVFGFGEESVPKDASPYTAREVGELRRKPLKNEQLQRMRTAVLAEAMNRCGQKYP